MAEYTAAALIFAELTDRYPIWQSALKDWNMTESAIVNTWTRQAAEEAERNGIAKGERNGLAKGRLIGQIHVFQELLHEPMSEKAVLAKLELSQLESLWQNLEARFEAFVADFRGQ